MWLKVAIGLIIMFLELQNFDLRLDNLTEIHEFLNFIFDFIFNLNHLENFYETGSSHIFIGILKKYSRNIVSLQL